MMFANLETADVYRDGGSYAATLRTAEGTEYQLRLNRSRMPDANGLHHRWLFAYFGPMHYGPGYPPCMPVVTGSSAERELIESLRAFIERGPGKTPEYTWARFIDMFRYIEKREPCFPADLRAAGFTM